MTKARNTVKADTSLTPMERSAIAGLQAREREVQREILEPLQKDSREVCGEIEARLGLSDGAIGTTHIPDSDGNGGMVVRELTPEERGQANGRVENPELSVVEE